MENAKFCISIPGKCTTRGSSYNYRIKKGNITCKMVHRTWMGTTERTSKDK